LRVAFPTDEHIPYHDPKARELALKIITDFNPDLMVAGSDAVDFYAVSSFDKDPKRAFGLQGEIDLFKKAQREWRDAAPNAKRVYLIGNHEDRLRRYLWRHPELDSLEALELPELLGLKELGISYDEGIDANLEIPIQNGLIRHGSLVRSSSAYTAKGEMDRLRYSTNLLTGHTHRGGSFYARTRDGFVQGHECFCLCSLNPAYVQYPDWQQGLVLVETEPFFQIEAIPFQTIRRRKATFWRGKQYTV